jgi:peptidoglycan hydrolase CwlO-like protein
MPNTTESRKLDREIEELKTQSAAEHKFSLGSPEKQNPFAGKTAELEFHRGRLKALVDAEQEASAKSFVAEHEKYKEFTLQHEEAQHRLQEVELSMRTLGKTVGPLKERLKAQYKGETQNDIVLAGRELGTHLYPFGETHQGACFPSELFKTKFAERVSREELAAAREYGKLEKEHRNIQNEVGSLLTQKQSFLQKHPEFSELTL